MTNAAPTTQRNGSRFNRRASFYAAELDEIATLREFNSDCIIRTFGSIILLELDPEVSGLHPHDVVGVRFEIGAAIENLDSESVLFETVSGSIERVRDQESQEAREAP